MDFKALLNPGSWFAKKPAQSKPQAAAAAPAGAEVDLGGIDFYTMPRMDGGVQPSSSAQTKRTGILIVAGGGVVLVAAVVGLVWYIFRSPAPAAPANPAVVPAENEPVAAPPAAETDAEPETVATTTETPTETTDAAECGLATVALSASTTPLFMEDVFGCVGEQLAVRCDAARLTVQTLAGTELLLTTEDIDGACTVTVTVPARIAPADTALQPYVDTVTACAYPRSQLLGATTAATGWNAWRMTLPLNLAAGHACTGSGVTAWEAAQAANPPADPFTAAPAAGLDSDRDGLTDVEEKTIYSSATDAVDTDGDGYEDGSEVANGYNPAGTGTLADSKLLKTYANDAYGYRIDHPIGWEAQAQNAGEIVLITAPVGGWMQVVVKDNAQELDIASWYRANVGEDAPASSVATKNSFEYIVSPDGLTVYGRLAGVTGRVLAISYSPAERIEYARTFEMMIRTLRL